LPSPAWSYDVSISIDPTKEVCMRSVVLLSLAAAMLASTCAASDLAVLPVDDAAWHSGLRGFPEGARFAVISGDPQNAEGFVVRVKLPAGSRVMPYRRPRDENIIVLRGALEVGAGRTFEACAMRTLTSGALVRLPANEWHHLATKGGATLQIFGMGPFATE